MNPCRWCGKTDPTDEPYKGFCSHDCWYSAMGHWDGWDDPNDNEDEE